LYRSTTYVGAAYCYRPSIAWSVGLSVCLSVTVMSPVKTAESIDMPFGIWTRVGPRKQVLGGVQTGATWRMPLKRPCAAAMRPAVKLLWPLVIIIRLHR